MRSRLVQVILMRYHDEIWYNESNEVLYTYLYCLILVVEIFNSIHKIQEQETNLEKIKLQIFN